MKKAKHRITIQVMLLVIGLAALAFTVWTPDSIDTLLFSLAQMALLLASK